MFTGSSPRQRGSRSTTAVTTAVAQHVRALRQSRGWSLDELSSRSGVSKGMVVQIEGDRTNPSVGTLSRIADAFGVAVGRLLEPAGERTVRICAAEHAPLLWRGGFGGFGRLLAGVNDPDFVELWEWTLAPRDRYESTDQAPGTRQLLHVLEGELVVNVAGAEHIVQAGETIDFVADKAHGYRNECPIETRVFSVLVMPPGEWDRR